MTDVTVSIYSSAHDARPKTPVTGTWDDFVGGLRDLLERTAQEKELLPGFVCCAFSGRRRNVNAGPHTALAIDVDDVRDQPALFAALERWRCVAYESPSSNTPGKGLRLRVVVALTEPVPPHAVKAARSALARELGLDPSQCGVDRANAVSQLMFIGRIDGTPERRLWSYDGEAWTPPKPGAEPERQANASTYAVQWSADRIPDLSAIARQMQPAEPGGLRRGGRDVCRALGGLLARHGYHPDAIEQAVREQLPSDQPDVRAEQARQCAEQLYDGDSHAAGYSVLEQRYGAEAVTQLEQAIGDPWVQRLLASWPPPRPSARLAGAPATPETSAEAALAALPDWVSDHVRACQEELRTPLALNIANALGTLACAVSGRLEVRIHSNYTAHTCLFVCSVAPPGELKSPSFRLCTSPIKAWVAEQQDAGREELQRKLLARHDLEARKAALEKARKQMWGEYDDAPEDKDLLAVRIALEAPEPVPFDFLVEDCTPEALSDLLATHGRIACLSSDASKVFSVLAGQYSKGQADLGVWLEAYDGSMPKVHRIGRKAVEPRHTQTTLSALLSIQPQVLERITGNAAMVGEGLVQRFCWVVCQSGGKRWAEGEIPTPVPTPIAETWDAGVRFLLDLPAQEVKLSAEAFRVYIAWRDELEGRLRAGDLAGELSGWASKHLERTARIAAVLWAAEGAEGEVSAEHMGRATVIAQWLIPHAVAALQGADVSSDEAAVLHCVARLAAKVGDSRAWVTRRGIQQCVTPKRLRRNADKVLVPLLKDLVGQGALEADAEITKVRIV